MKQSRIQQSFHQGPDSADGHKLGHEVFAARFQVGQNWHAFAHAREILQC